MSNPFTEFGLSAMNFYERRAEQRREARQFKKDADAPLIDSKAEKKQRDNERMLRSHKRWRREQYKAQLLGPNRAGWLKLAKALRNLSIDSGPALVEHVQQAAWLHAADRDCKHLALSVIGLAIARVRVRAGYAPFDDSLMHEEPTAYELIRTILTRRTAGD